MSANNNYEVTGILRIIGETIQVTDKFKRRDFVIEVENPENADYNQWAKLQFTQAKCDLLDAYKVGQTVNVKFSLQGKPFVKNGETLVFTNLNAWQINVPSTVNSISPVSKSPATVEEDMDTLPF